MQVLIRAILLSLLAAAPALGQGQIAFGGIRADTSKPVEVTADLYGESVKYDGVVRGLAGGTGAAFSLIPAQNASGNWIKVVQRVPVRIILDPAQVARHPLRVGLSMKASIDVSK